VPRKKAAEPVAVLTPELIAQFVAAQPKGQRDPVGFIRDVLGAELWSRQ
jgi:hypothetical protein